MHIHLTIGRTNDRSTNAQCVCLFIVCIPLTIRTFIYYVMEYTTIYTRIIAQSVHFACTRALHLETLHASLVYVYTLFYIAQALLGGACAQPQYKYMYIYLYRETW